MIVGLCSSYKEGRLVQGAIRSLHAACDRVLVFEGPAGPPLDANVPESDFEPWMINEENHRLPTLGKLRFTYGNWKTDAKKRTAMVEACRPFTEPTWGVWVDGDEVLMNAEYLRDWVAFHQSREDEGLTGKVMGWPIKIVEMDGSIAIVQAKVLRIDRLDSYSVSSSVFRNAMGQLEVRGNYRAHLSDVPALEQHLRGMASPAGGFLFHWPPLPCEPFIMHRSALRHPLRQGLRMHEQEAVELEKIPEYVASREEQS